MEVFFPCFFRKGKMGKDPTKSKQVVFGWMVSSFLEAVNGLRKCGSTKTTSKGLYGYSAPNIEADQKVFQAGVT